MALYGHATAQNMENAWQYCKVYPCHVNAYGLPTADYYKWAVQGWNSVRANRYPMGKGAKPLYSLWKGQRLDYIAARRQIYIPLYSREVQKTAAYKQLKQLYDNDEQIALIDFDGYNHKALGMTYEDVINNTCKPLGHAFILAMLLENYL